MVRGQRLLNRLYRQEQREFVGREWDETELLGVMFRLVIFGVHGKANPACVQTPLIACNRDGSAQLIILSNRR